MEWMLSKLEWVKAIHIIAVICWFACIFYLPRLFINHVMSEDQATKDRLYIMQRKLFRFSIPFPVVTVLSGLVLVAAYPAYYATATWFVLKFLLVASLIVYHFICGYFVRQFAQNQSRYGHVFYRWFNEYPTFVLFSVVILVSVRPF